MQFNNSNVLNRKTPGTSSGEWGLCGTVFAVLHPLTRNWQNVVFSRFFWFMFICHHFIVALLTCWTYRLSRNDPSLLEPSCRQNHGKHLMPKHHITFNHETFVNILSKLSYNQMMISQLYFRFFSHILELSDVDDQNDIHLSSIQDRSRLRYHFKPTPFRTQNLIPCQSWKTAVRCQ